MTAVATRVARHLSERDGGARHLAPPTGIRVRQWADNPYVVAVILFGVAVFLRLYAIVSSRNLNVDEATYAILVLGGLCALVMLVHDCTWRRLTSSGRSSQARVKIIVRAWAFSACAYLAYATLIGSIEEQMYYITLAPCLLALAHWLGGSTFFHRRVPRMALIVAIVLALAFDATVWTVVHVRDNNIYASFLDWEPDHVAEGSKIAVTEDIAQFLIKEATPRAMEYAGAARRKPGRLRSGQHRPHQSGLRRRHSGPARLSQDERHAGVSGAFSD
jgi:hypothetical protein